MNKLIYGDCLEEMRNIEDGSIDMVLADPPYGTTACRWDCVIPMDEMWSQLERIVKPSGAIVLTASQPFTSSLIMSNVGMFKYSWVWEKDQSHTPLNAKYQPLKVHEDIVVFGFMASTYSKKGNMSYNPQMTEGTPYKRGVNKDGMHKFHSKSIDVPSVKNNGTRFPRSVLKFNREVGLHPTQKPVSLMEYLVKTYSQENDIVLDFAMGSGSTGIACKNLNRRFIGIENDESYFDVAVARMNQNNGDI